MKTSYIVIGVILLQILFYFFVFNKSLIRSDALSDTMYIYNDSNLIR